MADNFAFLLKVLAQTGCQCHAPRLTALGITSVQALPDRASEAACQGVDAEDIASRGSQAGRTCRYADFTDFTEFVVNPTWTSQA